MQDVVAVDARLKGIVTGMLDRLKAGDVPGALKALTPQAAAKFEAVFSAIVFSPPQGQVTLDTFGSIATSFITETFAEYVVLRNKPTGSQAYFIYLMLQPDGVWRISHL